MRELRLTGACAGCLLALLLPFVVYSFFFLVLISTSSPIIGFVSLHSDSGSPGDTWNWFGLERKSPPLPLHHKVRLQSFCHSLLLSLTAPRCRNKFAKWDLRQPTTANPTVHAAAGQALTRKWTSHSARDILSTAAPHSACSRETHLSSWTFCPLPAPCAADIPSDFVAVPGRDP